MSSHWLKRFSRRLRLLIAMLLAAASIATVLPASAAHASVGRPNVAENEIRAYYDEFLGRPADPGGYNSYINRVYEDCRFGILAAGMMIGDAVEAHNRFRTPNAFVPALFRALLNRDADPGGYSTYVNVINLRGYRWAIVDLQSSGEFRNRLAAMCNGRRGAAMQNVVKADAAVQAAIGINDAGMTLVRACGIGTIINLAGAVASRGLYQATAAIKAAKLGLGAAIQRGAIGACLDAYQVLLMADTVASNARYEPGSTTPGYNNPTYVLIDIKEEWRWNGHFCKVNLAGGASASERSTRYVEFRC